MYYFLILTQYKSMKWLLIGFIFMFILLVVTYPFKISWYFHINLLNNIGFVVFKVLFIRLMCERFKIDNHFEFQTEREKKKNQVFFHNYIFCLSKRVDVKKIDVFCDVGSEEDAYFISMLNGYIDAVLAMVSGVFLNRFKSLKIFNNVEPYYEKSILEFTGKIIVSFNLISVLLSTIMAYKLTKKSRRGNDGRKKSDK